jgi:hypothetical protein
VIVGHIAQRLDLGLDRIEIGNRDPDMIEIADPVLLVAVTRSRRTGREDGQIGIIRADMDRKSPVLRRPLPADLPAEDIAQPFGRGRCIRDCEVDVFESWFWS